METGKLIWVTVITRFLLKENVPKQQFEIYSKSPSVDSSPSYSQVFEII